jgi:hypothetical protein
MHVQSEGRGLKRTSRRNASEWRVWLLCHSPKSFLLASVPHHHQAVQVKRSRSTHVRTSSGQPPKHYTIRDLLWLTLLAAVLVAWWVDRSKLAERINQFTTRVYPLVGPGRIIIHEGEPKLELVPPNPSAPATNPPSD